MDNLKDSVKQMDKDLSLIDLIEWLWHQKKLWIPASLIVGGIFWAMSWLLPPVFSSSVVILPKYGNSGLGSLNQLAGLAGLAIETPRNPEEAYSEIVMSDTVLDKLLSLPTKDNQTLGEKLTEQLGISGKDPRNRKFLLKEKLRDGVLDLDKNDENGIMKLYARIPKSSILAADVANELVKLLDQHIQDEWEQQGHLRANFIKSRLLEIEIELKRAQDAVTQFVVQNRSYNNSPKLIQKHNELVVEKQVVLAVWTKLREQLEIEQIDAHGELQALKILDWAQESIKPVSPQRKYFLALGLILGFMLAITIAGFRDARSS